MEVYSPDDIPIPPDRQSELQEGWRDLPSETHPYTDESEKALEDRCREILAELPDDATKKLQIISLILVLGNGEGRPHHCVIDRVVDASKPYVRSFKYDFNEHIVTNRTGLDQDRRDTVLSRDNHECVRCNSTDDLEIHHIIPYVDDGGEGLENLATLCNDCHFEAHGEQWGGDGVIYDSTAEFWEWIDE